MKKWMLLSLFIYSNSIWASNPNQVFLDFVLKNMNEIKPEISCSDITETKLTFKNCSPTQIEKIEKSVNYLIPKFQSRMSELEKYEKQKLTSIESIFFKEAKKNLSCIQKEIEKKMRFECVDSYLCESPYNYYMYTTPTLDHVFKDKLIRACPKFGEDSEQFIAGALVHEVSHLCGTDDLEYLGKLSQPMDTSPKFEYIIEGKNESGYKNADAYRYWFEKGFCLPEKDC